VLAVAAALSFAAAIPLCVLSHQVANGVIAAVIGVPSAAIGVLVIRRQRDNPLGWLFLASAVCQFVGTDGGGYALLAYRFGHHLPLAPVALALAQIWGPSLVVFLLAVLLFPDGRLPSQFWRWVLRVYGVLFVTLLLAEAVAMAGALAAHPVRVDESGGLAAVDHPVGWFNAMQGTLIVAIFGLSLSFIVRQGLSWRRATGEGRQQLKWLASGATVSIACQVLAASSGSSGTRLQDAVDPDVVRADLAGVVQAALEPTHVSVWLGR
jgi:two-component system NarL family sensor kinase